VSRYCAFSGEIVAQCREVGRWKRDWGETGLSSLIQGRTLEAVDGVVFLALSDTDGRAQLPDGSKVHHVLKDISRSDAQRLREFLAEAGYSDENLRKQGLYTELPSAKLRNAARLRDLVSEPTLLNRLLRWFWLGMPQEAEGPGGLIPSWFTEIALSCGLLRQEGTSLVATVMLFPSKQFLTACDPAVRIDARDPEFVLWPNPTTKLLYHFTVRRPSRASLDLGTGNAVQAMAASLHSDHVVATDLNERAVGYAKFSARLNGVENVECLAGDGFAPVEGRTFDLITSNPPFFISPSDHYLFCDNPMDLDGLCRRFVKEAPAYLNEDGYFQMLCEWAQIKGQPWTERISEWLDGTGCDAWVLMGNTQDAADYAQHRIADLAGTPERDAELYETYMAYYKARNVEGIHDGVIAMRKRSGKNWVLLEETPEVPNVPFGDFILASFEARDFLNAHQADEQMLTVKPRLSPHARLEQFFEPGEGRWKPTTLNLRLKKGLPFFIGLQAEVAGFLSGCDGSRTIGEMIEKFAPQVDAPFEKVQAECLGIMRRLLERGFLLF